MILFKTLRTNPRISHSLHRTISSNSSNPNPNPKTLSSLFLNPPSKSSQITKTSIKNKKFPISPNISNKNKPSTNHKLPKEKEKKSPIKKPSTNQKLPKEKEKNTPIKKPSTNGKLQNKPVEEKEFPKELSAEATMLVSRFIEDGYLKDANFSKGREPQQIPANFYSRNFLKIGAEKFGQKHQEVAKWLSGSELKKVALFGCPSLERKSIFAAKRLRAFFRIQEDVICRGCKLKNSCKFVNQRVGTKDKVVLEDVMRLVTVYSLDAVSPQLVITDELKCSIGKLVKEALCLSN